MRTFRGKGRESGLRGGEEGGQADRAAGGDCCRGCVEVAPHSVEAVFGKGAMFERSEKGQRVGLLRGLNPPVRRQILRLHAKCLFLLLNLELNVRLN
jgi:hypothetical protein